jgi:hypothetical protein
LDQVGDGPLGVFTVWEQPHHGYRMGRSISTRSKSRTGRLFVGRFTRLDLSYAGCSGMNGGLVGSILLINAWIGNWRLT